MKRIVIFGLTIILFLGIAGGLVFFLEETHSDNRDESNSQLYNSLRFRGNITWDDTFHIDGWISRGGLGRNVTTFHNMSLKIYSEEREFIRGWCLGTVNGSRERFSISCPERPQYVLFVSPDYWHPDRLDRFQVDYYRWVDEMYVGYSWDGEPRDLPVNPIANDPCAG